MCIVLVGGHDRMHSEYKDIGKEQGYKMKIFTQMPSNFIKSIGEPDAVVLFTNTVSHKMAITTVKETKRKNIPLFRCHTSSGSSLRETLMQLKTI